MVYIILTILMTVTHSEEAEDMFAGFLEDGNVVGILKSKVPLAT